jgi:hypothetical protein
MGDVSHFEPEFSRESNPDEDGPSHEDQRGTVSVSDGIQHRYAGAAFFPSAKEFIVTGGKFQNITHIQQAAPSTRPGEERSLIPVSMEAHYFV